MSTNQSKIFCTTENTTILKGTQDHGYRDDKGRAYGHRWDLRTYRTGAEVTMDEAMDTYSYVWSTRNWRENREEFTFYTNQGCAKGYQEGTPNTTSYVLHMHATRDGEDFGACKPGKGFATEAEAMAYVDTQLSAARKRAASHKKRDLDFEAPRRIVINAPVEETFLDLFQQRECGKDGYLIEPTPEVPEGAKITDRRS